MGMLIYDLRANTLMNVKPGIIVEYLSTSGDGSMTRAKAVEVFSNGDIRTDEDGVRCYGEYCVVEGGKNAV
jgi:hypothetical protein